jgi:hypothetical protein
MVDTFTRQVKLYQFSYIPSVGISRRRLWDSNVHGEIGKIAKYGKFAPATGHFVMFCASAVYYDPRGLFTATATSSTLANIRPSPVKRAALSISHDPEECKRRGIQQYCQRCRAGDGEEVQTAASASDEAMPLHSFVMSHVGSARVSTGLAIVASAVTVSDSAGVTDTGSASGYFTRTSASGEKRSRVHEWPATAFCSSQTPLDIHWQTQKIPRTNISQAGCSFRHGTQQHDAIDNSQAPSQSALLRNHHRNWIEHDPATYVLSQHTQTATSPAQEHMISSDRATLFSLAHCTGSTDDTADASSSCSNIMREAPNVTFKKTSPGPTASALTYSSFTGKMTVPLSASSLTAGCVSIFNAPNAELIELVQSSLAGDSRCCRYPLSQDELYQNFSWTSRIIQTCIPSLSLQ